MTPSDYHKFQIRSERIIARLLVKYGTRLLEKIMACEASHKHGDLISELHMYYIISNGCIDEESCSKDQNRIIYLIYLCSSPEQTNQDPKNL